VDGLFGVLTAVTPSTVAITTASQLPAGKIGTAYSKSLAVTGGSPGYSGWAVTGGSLPPGVSLDSATGTLNGTPIGIGGTFNFMVGVKDSTGATATNSFQLTIQQPATSALTRIGSFAHVSSGGGWNTRITLINLSASTVNAQVNLYADNGSRWGLPMTFPEFSSGTYASSIGVTLTPNDSVVIQTSASGPLAVGWADVQASGPLQGYLTFGVGSGGVPASEGTVPLDTRLSNSLVLPYDNTSGAQTALAIANQTATPQTVSVTLYDQTGAQLSSSSMNLPAYGHSSFFLTSNFSQLVNQLGIIQFQCAGGVTGVGLRFSPAGSFTSIPIIR
jgi:hypothetical protein